MRVIYTLFFYLLLPIVLLRLLWRAIAAPAYARRWAERRACTGSGQAGCRGDRRRRLAELLSPMGRARHAVPGAGPPNGS